MSLFAFLLKQKKLKYIFNGHEAIDLGIRAYNGKRLLWATCNIGASSPEEYGDYFAWGETTPKDVYSWDTYFDSNDTGTVTYKYPLSSRDIKLELEDDAAHVNWGDGWRMPTRQELVKLTMCTHFQSSYNDVNGTYIRGTNGNLIFFPNSGLIYEDGILYVDTRGRYLSNTGISSLRYAENFCLNSGDVFNNNGGYRCVGSSVRGVIELDNPTEIYYTTTDNQPIESSTNLNSMGLVSNTYENGIGILKFSKPVTWINPEAFKNCTSLTNITIPDSVTLIGSWAFENCSSLNNITISNNVTIIYGFAFSNCTSLTKITYNGTKEQWNAITKDDYWKYTVPTSCIVLCTDGNINI